MGLVNSLLGAGTSFFHHKLQIPFLVQSRKQDLIWYETTRPGLEIKLIPRKYTLFGCSVFWSWLCFISFDLEDLIEIKMPPSQTEAEF